MALLHDLLRRAAERHPEQELFVLRDRSLTYAEAATAASRLAGALAALGVRAGDRVALVLDNVPEYVIAYYGVLACGAAVVPLCPDTREAPLARALAHCEARAVVISGKGSGLLTDAAAQLPALRLLLTVGTPLVAPTEGLAVHTLAEVLDAASPLDGVRVDDGDLASIVYTSGTTAAPKGVMLSHRNVVSNTQSIVEYLGLVSTDRAALVLPLFYSYGNSVLHTHVAVGGTLVLLPSVAFPAAVLQGIQDHRCTGLPGVPSTFARLLHSTSFGSFDLSSLRYVTQAGGPMTPALADKLQRALPHAQVYVMYGQTEAAPRLSYLPPADLRRKPGSVGIPIPGVRLAVMDDAGRVLPPNVVGELVAQGENIMLGYWKDPEATSQVLRPEGLRTGDLSRVDEDGFFYIVGRNSDIIKSGAHRISPQEIEEVVERLPGVAQCAAVGIPDELLGEIIAVFVIRAPGAELTERDVARSCFEQLPRFKVPAHVVFREQLPRTESGKVQRAALKSWRPPAPPSPVA